jgi:large subunit ribosomal protein L2
MALQYKKPTTPTRRHTALLVDRAVSKARPNKSMLKHLSYSAGRNVSGKLTVRHKGGREKRHYRNIDFLRDKLNVPGVVKVIEYDPNRSANIALIYYKDGDKRYILAPQGLSIGDEVMSGNKASVKVGNALPLKNIPSAQFVHNIELLPGKGGVLVRTAGCSAQIQGVDKGYAQLKMPSGEIRLVRDLCYATIGVIGNLDFKNKKLGKAGRKRHMGIKPTVRGTAMSGGKHPHGDGQGKSGRHGPGGPAKDKWGNRIGKRTRKNKVTNKYIIKRRSTVRGNKFKNFKTII